ncbi:hypothetical protein NEF87_000211 [Candidatus Lokiarchaeum ossiferum]|uniref:Uncharacterized protein n=1 Tax=Candidatus Lokiarchaeum ossiferum TaxID=2951803 RepID=A0ABY6HKI4_9ARCH|nr:hypothetical protein NEF87_000211 [Candidatus Lokiarchaeum sp. B-35]
MVHFLQTITKGVRVAFSSYLLEINLFHFNNIKNGLVLKKSANKQK